jgi:hypothetical protein
VVLEIPNDKVVSVQTVSVAYVLKRNGEQKYSSREAKARVIGESLPDLVPPTVLTSVNGVLDPMQNLQGATGRVEVQGWRDGDMVQLVVEGTPGVGSPTFTPKPLNTNNQADFPLTRAFIEANMGKTVKVSYLFTRNGMSTESAPLELTVLMDFGFDTSAAALNIITINTTRWDRTGNPAPGESQTRTATTGYPPFTYQSAAPQIAGVEQVGNGCKVTAMGGGSTQVMVTDARSRTLSFTVLVTARSYNLLVAPNELTVAQAIAWRNGAGGTSLASVPNAAGILNAMYRPPSVFPLKATILGHPGDTYTNANILFDVPDGFSLTVGPLTGGNTPYPAVCLK